MLAIIPGVVQSKTCIVLSVLRTHENFVYTKTLYLLHPNGLLNTMPLIEVLPNSSSVSAPGWAYVPDTGYDPSKAPIQPSARKRNARTTGPGGGDTTIKQNTALLKHLAYLDKDNHKDVQISLPARVKEGGGRGNGTSQF